MNLLALVLTVSLFTVPLLGTYSDKAYDLIEITTSEVGLSDSDFVDIWGFPNDQRRNVKAAVSSIEDVVMSNEHVFTRDFDTPLLTLNGSICGTFEAERIILEDVSFSSCVMDGSTEMVIKVVADVIELGQVSGNSLGNTSLVLNASTIEVNGAQVGVNIPITNVQIIANSFTGSSVSVSSSEDLMLSSQSDTSIMIPDELDINLSSASGMIHILSSVNAATTTIRLSGDSSVGEGIRLEVSSFEILSGVSDIRGIISGTITFGTDEVAILSGTTPSGEFSIRNVVVGNLTTATIRPLTPPEATQGFGIVNLIANQDVVLDLSLSESTEFALTVFNSVQTSDGGAIVLDVSFFDGAASEIFFVMQLKQS